MEKARAVEVAAAMILHSLWAAFSFLTRLAPARLFTDAELAAAARWFPVTGAVLGLLASLPAAVGLAPAHPAIQALAYLLVMFWATRGLHWDGVADCLDAWGSGARGESFQAILKDSRVGTFGVLGIVLVLLIQLLSLTALLEYRDSRVWTLLILAPMLGRTAMLTLPAWLPPHSVSTLGRLVAPGCSPRLALLWGIPLLALFALTQGPRALAFGILLLGLPLAGLYRLAKREGGFNGDFLGCACLLAESAAWLAPLL